MHTHKQRQTQETTNRRYTVNKIDTVLQADTFAFSDFTLLVGRRKWHKACRIFAPTILKGFHGRPGLTTVTTDNGQVKSKPS